MGLVAEYGLPCEQLPLVDVAAAAPDATLTVELQFNHGDRPPFHVYATHDDHAAVERAFDDSTFVDRSVLVGRAGETRRYRVRPAVSMESLLGDRLDDLDDLRALATADAIVERIRATPSGWIQTTWFADRAAFDAFRSFWVRNDCFSLRRLTDDGDPEPPGDGLTDRQQEALRTAYEMGYFVIPRGASLDDVAAELGISASSLSERLRRAQTRLIETTRTAPVAGVVAYEPAYPVDDYRETADLAARMQARLDAGERREATKLHLREVLHGDDIDDLDAWLDQWPVWPAPVDHVENTLRMNRALEAHPLPDAFDVDAPALPLTGSEAPAHLRESVRAVHDALPESHLVEFEGVGHSGPTEAPERTAKTVREFLADVTQAAPRT